MKKHRYLLLIVGTVLITLSGCFQNGSPGLQYDVIVVQGKENVMKKFDKYASITKPIIKVDYYVSKKIAKEDNPNLDLNEVPIIYIFLKEKNEKRKMLLKTHNIEASITFLQSIR